MNKKLVSVCFSSLVFSSPIFAEEQPSIALSAGTFSVFDSGSTMEAGVEYRFAPGVLDLIPTLGVAINANGGYWGYAGVRYDVNIGQKWVLTPHVAVAAYEQGGSLDLGYDMEFRSGLDLAYRLSESSRLALGIYHLSNNGLGDDNPGSESMVLTYSLTPGF